MLRDLLKYSLKAYYTEAMVQLTVTKTGTENFITENYTYLLISSLNNNKTGHSYQVIFR